MTNNRKKYLKMKKRYYFFLISLFVAAACARQPMQMEVPIAGAPGERLYQKAEKRFQEQAYEQALELFRDYQALYPDSPLLPAVMIKIGAVHSARREFAEARAVYAELIHRYPESRLVTDARMDILSSYYQEGAYQEVLSNAGTIDDGAVSPSVRLRKYSMIADAQIAVENFVAAAKTYILLYNEVAESPKRDQILENLDKAASRLSPEDLSTLREGIEDSELRGHLLYLLGLRYVMDGRPQEALQALSEFVDTFPEDRNVPSANRLMEACQEDALYDRHLIGCLLPLSGKYEAFGRKALQGVQLALSEISQANGGADFQLIIKDTEGDPVKAAQAVRELALEDRAAAIIGPILTAQAAALEAQGQKIPIVTLTQKDHIVENGEYVFRNFLTPEMQVKTIVSYASMELGLERFAILYPDEKYGVTFMNLFWDEVLTYGGEVVGVEAYGAEQADFTDSIKKLVGLYYEVPEDLAAPEETPAFPEVAADEPDAGENLPEQEEEVSPEQEEEQPKAIVDFDAIFIPDGPEKTGLLLPQLTYYDVVNVFLLGTNLWHSDKLIQRANQDAHGAIMPEIFFAESANEKVVDFVNQYTDIFGEKPGFIEAVSYDTAMMMFTIVGRPEIRFRADIRNALLDLVNFEGVTGRTSFAENGEARKKLYLLQIRGGDFVELEHNPNGSVDP